MSETPPQATLERRRHIRLPTRLPARLISDDGSAFEGVIRDFCQGGVTFELDEANLSRFQSKHAFGAGPGLMRLQVADPAASVPFIELAVRLMRMQGSGAGLMFHQPDGNTLNRLAAVAQAAATNPLDATQGGSTRALVDETTRLEIAGALRKLVESYLATQLESLFKRAEETLFEAARDAKNNADQQGYFKALKETGCHPTVLRLGICGADPRAD